MAISNEDLKRGRIFTTGNEGRDSNEGMKEGSLRTGSGSNEDLKESSFSTSSQRNSDNDLKDGDKSKLEALKSEIKGYGPNEEMGSSSEVLVVTHSIVIKDKGNIDYLFCADGTIEKNAQHGDTTTSEILSKDNFEAEIKKIEEYQSALETGNLDNQEEAVNGIFSKKVKKEQQQEYTESLEEYPEEVQSSNDGKKGSESDIDKDSFKEELKESLKEALMEILGISKEKSKTSSVDRDESPTHDYSNRETESLDETQSLKGILKELLKEILEETLEKTQEQQQYQNSSPEMINEDSKSNHSPEHESLRELLKEKSQAWGEKSKSSTSYLGKLFEDYLDSNVGERTSSLNREDVKASLTSERGEAPSIKEIFDKEKEKRSGSVNKKKLHTNGALQISNEAHYSEAEMQEAEKDKNASYYETNNLHENTGEIIAGLQESDRQAAEKDKDAVFNPLHKNTGDIVEGLQEGDKKELADIIDGLKGGSRISEGETTQGIPQKQNDSDRSV